jgi:hypothetical protein
LQECLKIDWQDLQALLLAIAARSMRAMTQNPYYRSHICNAEISNKMSCALAWLTVLTERGCLTLELGRAVTSVPQ